MNYGDLRNKTEIELKNILEELNIKLGKLRFELANKTLKNFSEIPQVKKDIARILTALNIKHGK